MSKFAILIQGPLNQISLNNVENYKKFGNVYVSFWSDLIKPRWNSIKEAEKELERLGVTSAHTPSPDTAHTTGVDKKSTFYLALNSMLLGLQQIEEEFVIKVRSDEFYEDLEPFVSELKLNPNKIVCGNIFVRRDIPLHFGDHIFACRKDDLERAVRHLLGMYNSELSLEDWSAQAKGIPAEQILCKSILLQKGIKLNENSDRENFLNNVSIIDINKTGNFTARWGYKDISYKNQFKNPFNVKNTNDY